MAVLDLWKLSHIVPTQKLMSWNMCPSCNVLLIVFTFWKGTPGPSDWLIGHDTRSLKQLRLRIVTIIIQIEYVIVEIIRQSILLFIFTGSYKTLIEIWQVKTVCPVWHNEASQRMYNNGIGPLFVSEHVKTMHVKKRNPLWGSTICHIETSLNRTHFLVLELKLAISSWGSRERLRTWRT